MLAPPQEIMSRPGLARAIATAAEGQEPWIAPGPTRTEVLKMLS